ncbi:uncharacterized protein [Mytilus edulis]|uniref:uncharacterized protein n=1 Tax=Mytilus edulis TaxID=6550 RepID=UPI0039F044B6
MEISQCEPCKARDKNNTPTRWCVICEEALCLECTENHRVQKMSRGHELIDIDIKPKHINISDQRCSKHDNLSFEYFCIDHDTLCCKECQVETHRSCQKVMSVDIASKGIKKSQSFIDSVELIEHVLTTISIISNNRRTLIGSIEKEAQVIKDETRKLKEEAISQIESLENALLEDLKLKKNKIVTNAKVMLNEIQDIEKMTKEKKDTLALVEKHGSEKQTFLVVHAYKTTVTDFEKRINAITENTTQYKIKLNPNILKNKITSLGTIETIEVPTSFKFVQVKKRQSQIPVVQKHLTSLVRNQEVTFDTDSVISMNALTMNDKDELFMTFSRFPKYGIMGYNNQGKLNFTMFFMHRPFQIALFQREYKGVVTFYSEDIAQFVDFNNRKLLNTISVKDSQQGGVAVSNENIFIGSKGNISVLDLTGSFVRIIKLDNANLIPWCISLDRYGNICYTDSEAVCCITIDGENRFTYKPPNKNRPYEIVLDNQGYVYVVVENIGVCRLRPDGTFADTVVTKRWPSLDSICFNKDCTKFYTGCGKSIWVYNCFN